MKDKYLREQLRAAKVLGSSAERTTYAFDRLVGSGITSDKVEKYDHYSKQITALERKVEALMELLAVTQEGPTTDTILKKGAKKVTVKK